MSREIKVSFTEKPSKRPSYLLTPEQVDRVEDYINNVMKIPLNKVILSRELKTQRYHQEMNELNNRHAQTSPTASSINKWQQEMNEITKKYTQTASPSPSPSAKADVSNPYRDSTIVIPPIPGQKTAPTAPKINRHESRIQESRIQESRIQKPKIYRF